MAKTAKIIIDGRTYDLPVVKGSEGEMALDISTLRKRTGLITLDPGYPEFRILHLGGYRRNDVGGGYELRGFLGDGRSTENKHERNH